MAARDEMGQSVIEFVLCVPLLIALTVIMLRVNTAIQMSIVDQQYARAQALYLAFNSNTYPELRQRVPNVTGKNYNQVMFGISDNVAPQVGEGTGTYNPKASVQNVSRSVAMSGSDEPQTEPAQRSRVRIRNTVSLCTQINVLDSGKGSQPILPLQLAGGTPTMPLFTAAGLYNLPEGSPSFSYCKGNVE